MLKGDEGVFPNVDFGFAKTNVACNVGFLSHTQSFLIWEAIVVKRG